MRIIRRELGKLLRRYLEKQHRVIVSYRTMERMKIFKQIESIRKNGMMLLDLPEAFQLVCAVMQTRKVLGDLAEVGTYKGGSAKLICETKRKEDKFYIFDTFDGLPDQIHKADSINFKNGDYKARVDEVSKYLRKYENVTIIKGLFPETGKCIMNNKFSLVHLDVDLYKSTKDCLEFFYSRMAKGGIIVSHDYVTSPGVKMAIDDFFMSKRDPVIVMSGNQCLIVKVENE